jgi:hypothetical protein
MTTTSLEDLARELGGRIESCEYFNPNVGEWARQRLRARRGTYRLAIFVSESRISIDVKGFDTRVMFSVGEVDQVCGLNKRFDVPLSGLSRPVFIGTLADQATMAWLKTPVNIAALSRFQLDSMESLQVYRNAVVLIGDLTRGTAKNIEMLCELADHVCTCDEPLLIDGLTFNVENVPEDLRILESLVRRFAVGDDDLRCEILAAVSSIERGQLRDRVTPLLPQINQFLDSFADRPQSSEAILIGYLAEAVCELGLHDV